MLVLGINDGHNSSASVYEDGRLRAALSEERLRRIKNWAGFPEQAIHECLRIAGRRLEEVDHFAVVGLGGGFTLFKREEIIAAYSQRSGTARLQLGRAQQSLIRAVYQGPVRDLYRATPLWKARDRARWRARVASVLALGVPEEKIGLVEHHLAHAATAYYGWGRFDDEILVLTADGGGDDLCATVNVGRQGKLERLAEVNWSESIGNVYAMATCILGMVPLEHEYKLMGMAPYAEAKGTEKVFRDLQGLFGFDGPQGMMWSRRNGCPETFNSYGYLRQLFELRRFDAVCGGLQKFTEEFITQWVRNCVRATGIRKIALAGGLFMNVKLNKAIMELPEVEDMFIFPSCGDETNAIGVAYHTYAEHADYRRMQPLQEFYLGPEHDDEQIGRAVREYDFRHPVMVQQPERIEEAVAELLARGEVVARFNGREEFGARSLGNRSILADPARPEVVKVINDAIKSRDFWMPFAPSVLERRADDYFINPKQITAPYMILCFDSTDRVSEFRAACHPYDLTLRPQVVTRAMNPSYYGLLEAFERQTGRGIILNTSFNLHGYPIVSRPQDALHVLDESGLNHLAIGGYLVHKRA